MIELRDVTKVFRTGDTEVRAVDGVSLTIPRGAFWAITGPSGSGKSTVLHLVAGLTPVTSGMVRVNGAEILATDSDAAAVMRRHTIGYILQHFALLPFLTARQNVAMPLILDGVAQRDVDRRVDDALAIVGMSRRSGHKPSELSGGEQQRVAIARALVIEPTVMLADEPTGNLDRAGGTVVMDTLQDVNERLGVTILLVTHDDAFAARAGRRLAMSDGRLTG